jgi:hypothetical protein
MWPEMLRRAGVFEGRDGPISRRERPAVDALAPGDILAFPPEKVRETELPDAATLALCA